MSKVDTSKAKCDTCGKPYEDGVMLYGIATKFDQDADDPKVMTSFRHAQCHVPIEEHFDALRKGVNDLQRKFR